MHTYIHAYIHTYMHTYVHTYIHTCMHTYIHTYIHIVICYMSHTCYIAKISLRSLLLQTAYFSPFKGILIRLYLYKYFKRHFLNFSCKEEDQSSAPDSLHTGDNFEELSRERETLAHEMRTALSGHGPTDSPPQEARQKSPLESNYAMVSD